MNPYKVPFISVILLASFSAQADRTFDFRKVPTSKLLEEVKFRSVTGKKNYVGVSCMPNRIDDPITSGLKFAIYDFENGGYPLTKEKEFPPGFRGKEKGFRILDSETYLMWLEVCNGLLAPKIEQFLNNGSQKSVKIVVRAGAEDRYSDDFIRKYLDSTYIVQTLEITKDLQVTLTTARYPFQLSDGGISHDFDLHLRDMFKNPDIKRFVQTIFDTAFINWNNDFRGNPEPMVLRTVSKMVMGDNLPWIFE